MVGSIREGPSSRNSFALRYTGVVTCHSWEDLSVLWDRGRRMGIFKKTKKDLLGEFVSKQFSKGESRNFANFSTEDFPIAFFARVEVFFRRILQ